MPWLTYQKALLVMRNICLFASRRRWRNGFKCTFSSKYIPKQSSISTHHKTSSSLLRSHRHLDRRLDASLHSCVTHWPLPRVQFLFNLSPTGSDATYANIVVHVFGSEWNAVIDEILDEREWWDERTRCSLVTCITSRKRVISEMEKMSTNWYIFDVLPRYPTTSIESFVPWWAAITSSSGTALIPLIQHNSDTASHSSSSSSDLHLLVDSSQLNTMVTIDFHQPASFDI